MGVAREIPMTGHIQTLEQSKCHLRPGKGDIISMAHLGTSEGGYEVTLLSDKLSTKGRVAFVICLFQWRKIELISSKGIPQSSHREKPAGQVHKVIQSRVYE